LHGSPLRGWKGTPIVDSAVFGAVAAVTGIASSALAFLAGQAILAGKSLGTYIGAPGAIRPVIGAGLYLAVLGLLTWAWAP
jgi:ABC-2 type transport system permease protein